jgi:hypothetical protein
VNKFFLLICVSVLNFGCSFDSKPPIQRIKGNENLNRQNSNYQNYNDYSSPNYKTNSRIKNSGSQNLEANSRLYRNPYNFPNSYEQRGVYDYDQYYVAPMQYNNIEPERKSVILNKY